MVNISGLYPGKPAGTRKIRLSDEEIRANWIAIDNWSAADHDGNGHHAVVIFTPQSLPASIADQGKVCGSDVNGKIELFYTDEDSNDVQITEAGVLKTFVAGTKMYFYQNTAPTGWTIDATCADSLLAVKGGSQAYNVLGGNRAGTWTTPSHTLTTAEIPSHSHPMNRHTSGTPNAYSGYFPYAYLFQSAKNSTNTSICQSVGGGGSHNHGSTYRPLANIGIICTKN